MRVLVRVTDRRLPAAGSQPSLLRASSLGAGADGEEDPGGSEALRLTVLEAMQLKQLRELLSLQLAMSRGSVESLVPSRPSTAPARESGRLAASLAAAAGADEGRLRPFQPPARAAPRRRRRCEELALQLVFNGRLLGAQDEARALDDLGVADGSTLHCLVYARVNMDQEISCYPHQGSVDGGSVVHVLGSRFPASARIACKFGTVVVGAELEDDGEEGGISQLRTVTPPHPAGAVTVAVSFDGGATWLGGPTYWYVDPELFACPRSIQVPAFCPAESRVKTDATLQGIKRNDDRDGSSGCA